MVLSVPSSVLFDERAIELGFLDSEGVTPVVSGQSLIVVSMEVELQHKDRVCLDVAASPMHEEAEGGSVRIGD